MRTTCLDIYLRKKRWKMLRNLLLGEAAYLAVGIFVSLFNFRAALFGLWLPLVLTRFFMMAGNWAQHAFVDYSDSENSYRNTVTCINSRFNHRAFNDGYHIGHHLKSSMHWTDMPGEFQKNQAAYTREGAIVFRGLDWGVVWFLLMIKAYPTLARHYVQLGAETLSESEIIKLLKSRTAYAEGYRLIPRSSELWSPEIPSLPR
jgi:fatty acid desaturase